MRSWGASAWCTDGGRQSPRRGLRRYSGALQFVSARPARSVLCCAAACHRLQELWACNHAPWPGALTLQAALRSQTLSWAAVVATALPAAEQLPTCWKMESLTPLSREASWYASGTHLKVGTSSKARAMAWAAPTSSGSYMVSKTWGPRSGRGQPRPENAPKPALCPPRGQAGASERAHAPQTTARTCAWRPPGRGARLPAGTAGTR